MDSSSHSSSSTSSRVSDNSVLRNDVGETFAPSDALISSFTEEIIAYENNNDAADVVKSYNPLCTPESFVSHANFPSPGGTVYYIPKVPSDVLLVKGTRYESVDACIDAYTKYAAAAGFVIRKSSQKRKRGGIVKQKYLVCNRMGNPKGIRIDTLDLENSDKQKRNSNLHVTGCKARAVFNMDSRTGEFYLNVFDTIHNHELEHEDYRHLSKTQRQLSYLEQVFIVKAASVNIGATKAHHLLTGLKGSYLLVRGTTVDFKNFFRSVNCYIGDYDAQMLIKKMEVRMLRVPEFTFDFFADDNELTAIFWADEVCKYNYKEFGDVVSFDATFKTNKYNMVFVPFTAIDNHRRCVTVAFGLLKNETKVSYQWLLHAFMKCYGKAPDIVVTDQDASMKVAIESEFPGSKHRLCMWHITQKFPSKICSKIYDESDFREKLNKIVWNMYIGPNEFEFRWRKLMEEFNLENHEWLKSMFDLRSYWIPAFFVDSPLCGLMRTTSRSESENSFFSHFTNSSSTLMNFMNCFETAMEKQRHVQEMMDHKSLSTVPVLKTFLEIEKHASNVYTRSLFELVQREICVGLWHCNVESKSVVEGSEVCIIKQSEYVYELMSKKKKNKKKISSECAVQDKVEGNKPEEKDPIDLLFKKDGLYKVLRNVEDGSVVCSCQLFMRVGILCKHIFCVFKNANVQQIPQQYILRRWTKNLIPAALRNKRNRYGEKNVVVENYSNEATSIVERCVHLLSRDEPRLGKFVEKLRSLEKDVEADCPNPPSKNINDVLEQLVGAPQPNDDDVLVGNPVVGVTRGRKKLRIKGGKEKAIAKSLKGKNQCSLCFGTDHNKRTCPKRFEVPFVTGVLQNEVVQEVPTEVLQDEVVQEVPTEV